MILEIQQKVYRAKIKQFLDRLERQILSRFEKLEAEYSRSKDPVSFDDRLKLTYQAIEEGQEWGQTWDSAWFHLQGRIPPAWAGREVVAHLDFNGEALIFSSSGEPLQGLTNGSIFGNITRHTFLITQKSLANEPVDLWVETAANAIMGINCPRDPGRGNSIVENIGNEIALRGASAIPGEQIGRHGSYRGVANRMRIALYPKDLYNLWLDMELLNGLLDTVPASGSRYSRILEGLVEVTNRFQDNEENTGRCRELLAPLLKQPAHASAPVINAIGHAHIDTGWLWPVRETIRKSARTFANQLELLDRYPDYVFGASQPQHYLFVKDHYPALYDRIRKAVSEGRWELQGGMWVEPDCNLISGESFIRQILHGKNFFKDEFGEEVTNCWIPDVFGYSASMPQILKLAGINHFLTQKMSWSQFNRFPYTTFRWRGIDGTEVLTHFPPEDTYNSQLQPYDLQRSEANFVEKAVLDEMLCLFGVGDGGGGPTAEMIERGLRQQNLEGSPKIRFDRADRFFERISEKQDRLPVWSGELYLELHRGTLTTQARTKRNNRFLEQSLRETEYLLGLGELSDYPIMELDGIWKTLLINQFHDILPGSSIRWVYDVTEQEHAQALEDCSRIRTEAAERMMAADPGALTVINTLNVLHDREIRLPEDWEGGLQDESGNEVPVQQESDGTKVAQLSLEPQAIRTLRRGEGKSMVQPIQSLVLENDLVRYEFNEHGQLTRVQDKEMQVEMLASGALGNVFTLYEDRPYNWDAWEVDITYEEMVIETAKGQGWTSLGRGPVRQGLRFELSVGSSRILQKTTLANNSKALEFESEVDWQECHRMLRTAFPVNVRTDSATFDIQYGNVKRPTHRNTSWDMARFEVAAQKYVDLSDHDKGVALLNDCKYGHKVLENVIDLNLLRAPTYPDPDADQGEHRFCYVLYPHCNDFLQSDVIEKAHQLNQAPILFPGKSQSELKPPVIVQGAGIGLEVLKRAEKEKCWVVRMVERRGRTSKAMVELTDSRCHLQETDLMEWNDAEKLLSGPIELDFKPFQIRTFKIK